MGRGGGASIGRNVGALCVCQKTKQGEIDMRTEEEIAEEARRLRRERMKRHAAIMAKHKETKPTPAVEPATSAAAAPVAAAPVEDGITDEHPMYKVSSSGPPPDVPKRTRQQGRGADNVLDALPQSSFDMFDVDQLEVTEEEKKQAAATVRGTGDDRREVANALNKAGTMGNMDDWDDHEGYYKVQIARAVNASRRKHQPHMLLAVGVWVFAHLGSSVFSPRLVN